MARNGTQMRRQKAHYLGKFCILKVMYRMFFVKCCSVFWQADDRQKLQKALVVEQQKKSSTEMKGQKPLEQSKFNCFPKH